MKGGAKVYLQARMLKRWWQLPVLDSAATLVRCSL